MTSVRGQGRPARRGQASEAPTGPPSSNGDHEDPLGSDKLGPSEASAIPPEAPPRPSQAPPLSNVPRNPGANCYSQQDLDRIIQTFLQNSKSGFGNKLKAKTPDVYRGSSHMECYNFCQQYQDHFATYGAIEPNWIPFAASFLRDQINFRWQ